MTWTHRFRIRAPVEAIYDVAFAPERWFSFFSAYRGLDHVDPSWPDVGSTIVVRYALLGPWTMRLRQTVVEHERGRRLALHEEALAGLWVDRPAFSFEPDDGATVHVITPRAMRRLATMVEEAVAGGG
jgi:hypothetical protein